MGTEQSDFIARFRRAAAWAVSLMAIGACLVVGLIVYNVMLGDFTRTIQAGIVNLTSNALKGGVSTENREGLQQLGSFVGPLIKANSYQQVVVLDASGAVVFGASVAGTSAVVPPEPADVNRALKGAVVGRIEDINGVRSLHVVAPLKGPEGKPAPGVLSGHRPLMLFLEGAIQTIALLTFTIILFAAVAYAMLWQFTKRAAGELARHEAITSTLETRLGTSLTDLEQQVLGTLQSLSSAVDAKDSYTARHSLNVADYACGVARHMGREDLVTTLERAGLLHDVGKIGIPEALLQKPSSLTPDEFKIVAEHSRLGAGIIETIPFLHPIVPAVLHHHEHWNGEGYPDGLAGYAIPVEARILAVADAFDAMTTVRPYRAAMHVDDACEELRIYSGTQFDPEVVTAFLDAFASPSIGSGRPLRFRGDRGVRSGRSPVQAG